MSITWPRSSQVLEVRPRNSSKPPPHRGTAQLSCQASLRHMDDAQIQSLVLALDTTNTLDEDSAWSKLKPLGVDVVPHLATFYPKAKRWQGRASLVFHSIRYARESEAAFKLGLEALSDKSTVVRYRACGLCAYSLRKDALPALQALLKHKDAKTVEDARAAIDAIKHQNHHYFYDRTHSGSSYWVVNDSDEREENSALFARSSATLFVALVIAGLLAVALIWTFGSVG